MSIYMWSLIQNRRRRMRAFLVLGWIVCSIIWSAPAWAGKTLVWDRNIESDMKEYRIYLCLVVQCTATKGATPTAVVPQPPDGTIPTWTLPIGVEGAAVVTAVDRDDLESEESNMVSFETKAPGPPSNVRIP